MNELIKQAKRENAFIFDTFKNIKKAGLRTKEGQDKLLSAKTALLAHLKRGDDEIYPALRKAAQNDAELMKGLLLFEDDVKAVAELAHEFFRKYSQGGSDIEFITDFGQLFMALKMRIAIEEGIFFTRCEKYSFHNGFVLEKIEKYNGM